MSHSCMCFGCDFKPSFDADNMACDRGSSELTQSCADHAPKDEKARAVIDGAGSRTTVTVARPAGGAYFTFAAIDS